jgi:anti-sigma B factor antagonist
MAMNDFFTTREVDGVAIVTFQQPQILDAVTIERMAAGLKELLNRQSQDRVVFDFANVTYLSSSALGMLIGLQRRALQGKKQLKFAGIRDEIMEVFRITKLDTVFDIYRDAKSASEACRKNL